MFAAIAKYETDGESGIHESAVLYSKGTRRVLWGMLLFLQHTFAIEKRLRLFHALGVVAGSGVVAESCASRFLRCTARLCPWLSSLFSKSRRAGSQAVTATRPPFARCRRARSRTTPRDSGAAVPGSAGDA